MYSLACVHSQAIGYFNIKFLLLLHIGRICSEVGEGSLEAEDW